VPGLPGDAPTGLDDAPTGIDDVASTWTAAGLVEGASSSAQSSSPPGTSLAWLGGTLVRPGLVLKNEREKDL
jgi:hypothetical protein